MEMKQFAKAVLAAVREKADGKFSVWLIETEDCNGVGMTGITTENGNSSAEMCFYLDECFRDFEKGTVSVEETADAVCGYIMENYKRFPEISVEDLLRWESVREFIYPKLIHTGLSREQLQQIPHRSVRKLTVVYYLKVTEDKDGTGSILIRNHHMELWEQNEEALYEAALMNVRGSGDSAFEDLLNFIFSRC